MFEFGLKVLISYLIGSVMGALVLGRLRGGVDIRSMGSGNAGGTNALRTQGWRFALGVVLVDIGKGMLATGVIPALELPFVTENSNLPLIWITIACAFASVIGHVWPIWHKFRGGKGAATLIGTLIIIGPWLLIPILIVWFIVLVISGFVGLATICAGISAALAAGFISESLGNPLFLYCAVMSVYLLYSHRSNIERMRQGTENRMHSVTLFRRPR